MTIYLVRPSSGSQFGCSPPLSLGYLASSLQAAGYDDIEIVDGVLQGFSAEDTIEHIAKGKAPKFIGIQVYTGSHTWARDFSLLAKQRFPDVPVIVGGPHISVLTEMAMEYIDCDYGVFGEGERAIVDFAHFLDGKISDPSDVVALFYKNDKGSWTRAKDMNGAYADANDIPMPAWDLLNPAQYFEHMNSLTLPLRGRRAVPLLGSRGCPYKCTFCSSPFLTDSNRSMRYRTPENIIEEIRYLKENFGVDEILFNDDNLTLNMKRAEIFFGEMIKADLNISWRAPNGVRVDRLNEGLVKVMAKSGGYFIGVGVETGAPSTMARMKKSLDLNNVEPGVRLLRKYGFLVNGFFIVGLREETEEEIEETIQFALSVPFDRVQCGFYIPYPGSEDWDVILERLDVEKYHDNVMDFQRNGKVPDFQSMPIERIMDLQKKFHLCFYMRPRILFSMTLNFRFSQLRAFATHPWVRRWFRGQGKTYYDSDMTVQKASLSS